MRVASAVDVSCFVEGLALLPLGERHGAESPVGCRELEDVSEVVGWRRAVAGIGCSAARYEDVVRVAGVRRATVSEKRWGALGALAGGYRVGARAGP